MKLLLLVISLFLISCASGPTVDVDDVKVTRDTPPEKCKPLGKVVGRVMTIKQTRKDAMKDLKQSAANKGADYVKVNQVSDHGTSITGEGFACDVD